MPLVESAVIEHTNHPYTLALRNVENAAANVTSAENYAAVANNDATNFNNRLTFYRTVFGDRNTDPSAELTRIIQLAPDADPIERIYLANMIADRIGDRLWTRYEDARGTVIAAQDSLRTCQSQLSQYRRALAIIPMPESRTITVDQAKAALQGFPIKHIRLYTFADNHTTLRFTVFDQLMTVHGSTPMRSITPGAMPKIKLPPISVSINFATGAVHLTPYTPARYRHGTGMSGYRQAHPHVMTANGQPCFGDFSGTISEAITKVDITTTATLILMFLQQADSNDTAGKHAHYWARTPANTAYNYLIMTDSHGNVTLGRMRTNRATRADFTVDERPATRDIDTCSDLYELEDRYMDEQIYNHNTMPFPADGTLEDHARPPTPPIVDQNVPAELDAPPAHITVAADYGDDDVAIEPPHEIW